MATNDRRGRTEYRLAILLAVFAAGIGGLALGTQPAQGVADIQMGELRIPDANESVDGNVTDVRVQTDLEWQYTVPDATRVVVKLMAGPSESALETLTFTSQQASGSGSGQTTLDASLLDASAYTANDFDPATAETTAQEVVVGAVLEVRRASGEAVTATVTEPVTIRVRDGTTLEAEIGGVGSVTIRTE